MIIIKVSKNIKRFINKCVDLNINLYNITYHDKYIICKIHESDYENIKKKNYYSKIEILNYTGKKRLIDILKNYYVDFIFLSLFILFIYLISNIVISVEIKHESKDIRERIEYLLKESGIKKFTIVKDLGTLNKISDDILNNNRDFLDFISINRDGMKYVVSVEERIIIKEKEENKYCHIVASRDGSITKIINESGVSLVENGSIVKKGDILITGEILLNDEVKNNTCAKGKVYANTWYKVNVIYPLKKEIKNKTGLYKYNISYNKNNLFKVNYKEYKEEVLFKIFNIRFLRQSEIKSHIYNYKYTDAYDLAIDAGINGLKNQIGEDAKVIEKKVLKVNRFNSKIELEMFVNVNEQIGKSITYEGCD